MANRHQQFRRREPNPYEHRGAHHTDRSQRMGRNRESENYDPGFSEESEYRGTRSSQPYGDQWNRNGNYRDSYSGHPYNRSDNWEEDRYNDRDDYQYRRPQQRYQQNPYTDQNESFYNRNERSWNRGNRQDEDRYSRHNRRWHEEQNRGYDQQDRNWWDRTKDEVSSWFGDDEAQWRRSQDLREQGNGNYRGVGPKGYHRSDERIRDDINDRLSDDPYVDASDIEVLVENGEVTLSGRVMSKAIKRRAEDIAESVSAVSNVENRIRISPFSKDGQEMAEKEESSNSRQNKSKG